MTRRAIRRMLVDYEDEPPFATVDAMCDAFGWARRSRSRFCATSRRPAHAVLTIRALEARDAAPEHVAAPREREEVARVVVARDNSGMAPRLELFPFRYRDPRTGKWVWARCVAELHEIKRQYVEWEIHRAAGDPRR